MCGIEISESASTKDIDPNDILDGLESNHNVECPISQVFLVSAMWLVRGGQVKAREKRWYVRLVHNIDNMIS